MEFMLIAVLVMITAPLEYLDAFNVDTRNVKIFSPPSNYKGSFFGYSVALHSNTAGKWLLVGAPLSDVKDADNIKLLKNFGAVFKCKISSSSCEYIPIDNIANKQQFGLLNNKQTLLNMEEKEKQWLGAVLESTGKNGKVVTCAPRYAYRGMPPHASSKFQYKWILGRCFEVESSLSGPKTTINPCRNKKKGNNYYGYCQTGFSAKITRDKQYIAMGAVGISRWKGGVISYSPTLETTVFSTQDQINHGNYMGYSVSSGFFGLLNKTGIVGGAPRAENLKGKVLIYQIEGQLTVSAALPQPKNIKMGSYFGSVLCSVDLNNDGYTDMLVGAPLYSESQDEGRVFVYVNNKKGALNLMPDMDLTGDEKINGRFGSSIASVGDLNKDGFEDVVVGAPNEDNGAGAVYVYHGTKAGIDPKYKQKIQASEVQTNLSWFGQSITGGLDVDDNGYPDFAVGAYGSDKAVLFISQKVINVEASIKLSVQRIVLENNQTMCKEADDTLHKCLNVTVCFRNLEKPRSDLNISYKAELDRDKGSVALRRMYFYNNTKKSFVISRQQIMNFQGSETVCLSPYTVHLRDKNRIVDLLSVLTVDLSFDLADTSCPSCAVLNEYKSKDTRAVATFQKDCGSDICKPDLAVTGKLVIPGNLTEVRIGTVEELTLLLNVKNKAPDAAYLAQVVISYPSTFDYIGPRAADLVSCITSATSNGTETATCTVGNPLKGNSNKTVGIKFGTTELVNDFYITITAKSVNEDVTIKDNEMKLKVGVKFEADLEVLGSSVPNEVIYEGKAKKVSEIKTQSDIGPKIVHTIIVQNNGPSKVDGSEISISVPSRYLDDPEGYLLYMLQVELTGASGSCITKGLLNPRKIPVGNVTTESKESRRKRRDAELLDCRHTTCKTFECRLGLLLPGEKAEITIRSRLWQSTLIKKKPGSVRLITLAEVSIPDDKRYTQPNKKNDKAKIITNANPVSLGQAKQKTPWWVYFLAALGGILLLAIAIGIMYKLGFFKRKRVKDISNPQTDDPLVS